MVRKVLTFVAPRPLIYGPPKIVRRILLDVIRLHILPLITPDQSAFLGY